MAFYNPYRTRPDDEKVTQPNFGGVRSISFTDPTTISRDRALADSLRQQSMTPLNMGTAGGHVIPPSPIQGVAKLGEALVAGLTERRAKQKEEANKQLNTNITSEMLRTAGSPVVERRPQTVGGQPVTQSQLMSNIQPTEIADAYSPEALSRASALGLGDPNASDATKQLALQLNLKAMEQAHGIKKAERAAVVAEETRTKDMEDYKAKEKFKNSLLKDKEPQNIQIFKTLYPDLDITSKDGIAAYDRLFGKKGEKNIFNIGGEKGKNQILQKVSEQQITQMYENAPQVKQNLSQSDKGLGLLQEILKAGEVTSKLTPFFNELNQYLGAITGDPDVLKGVSIKEAFNVVMGDKVMGRIQETKGAVSEKEMAYFGSISPGLDKTPFANYLLLEIDRRAQERQLDKLKYLDDWFAGTSESGEKRLSLFDDEGFDEWYMKNHDPYGGKFDIEELNKSFDIFSITDEEEPVDDLVKEYLE